MSDEVLAQVLTVATLVSPSRIRPANPQQTGRAMNLG